MKKALFVQVIVFLVAAGLLAHDTWLVPTTFRVTPGQPVQVALNTSEDFPSSDAAPTPDRIARFEVATAAGRSAVTGYRVEGKSLVAEVKPGPGATLVAAVTHPRLIVLKPEEFNAYLAEEGLDAIVAARAARGQSKAEGRERYSKVAKLALCGGEAAEDVQSSQPLGLPLEIVPQTHPCSLRAGSQRHSRLRVRVLFQGKPLVNAWVGAGYSGVHGHRYPVWVKTDRKGFASIPLDRPGLWFVRVLHMVPATESADADWQSWFSTFTFVVQ